MNMIMMNINDMYKDESLKNIAPILKNKTERINDVVKFLRMVLLDEDIYPYLEKIENVMKEQHEDGTYYFTNEDWFFFGKIFK